MRFAKSKLLNVARFKKSLKQLEDAGEPTISLFKGTIKQALGQLETSQNQGVATAKLVENYTWMIDQLVVLAWQQHKENFAINDAIQLIAVGGYGRGELHPYSDVDLLILLSNENYQEIKEFIENFLRFLWDIGLEIGHSLRSIKDCLKEARQDVTVMTNLLESRHLTGEPSLLETLDYKIRNSRIWPSDKFFNEKVQEQENRHAQYQDTAYSLEPNIKESPGGLRDLQTILWVYNRRFGVRSFKEMSEQGHINEDEYRLLIRARNILWKLRASLHLSTHRHEDRLLFDSQRQLASEFGYSDTKANLAVEQLMKRYYRTAKQIIYLNEVLLSHYRVTHINRFSLASQKQIDDDFVVQNKMIMQRRSDLFKRRPIVMIQLFLHMQQKNITMIHPDTIRAIRANLDQVNNNFRSDPKAKSLFLDLFKDEGIGLTNALARMNAYGLLGAYLPSFGAIVGQMQHDLFHVYTVDGHTLMVIQNLTRLRKYIDEYPLASEIFENLYKPERLFIGALFHDIAKGRGGDHSVLGESDAYEFCISHNLTEYDAKLVGWLVLNHLIMSHFSQRRDITDFEVIKEFADIVGDVEHLDNLYLLTLADIRGTSPKVWNAWKGQLLMELYVATRNALRQGVATPLNQQERIEANQQEALELIKAKSSDKNFNSEIFEQFWSSLPNDYFVRNEPYYLAWHASSLASTSALGLPIVSVRFSERLEANMFFVFAPEVNTLLTHVTAAFDNLDLDIVEARLQRSTNGFALHSFTAIVGDSESAKKANYMRFLETEIRNYLLKQEIEKPILRRSSSRALKHFPTKASVVFSFNKPTYTAMEVVAQNQPGLLHNVALILQRHNVTLLSARIATFGERAEDIFYIQQHDHTPVTDKAILDTLEKEITTALDRSQPSKKIA
ncbi:MAG: [protein-PII] uridylyltransferase [Acidiferrobacterales bacterium]|nr:[protein-PII] uridylyltransferase [Acidiferrobacterales bacterium]